MYIKNENKLWIAGNHLNLEPKMANRHGLITGATGTGKTVSLKVLAEGFSEMGVPVFLSDIKGDLSGFLQPVIVNESLTKRLTKLCVNDFEPTTYPVRFFDVFKENGHPLRATISDVGPQLLSRLLSLNDTQSAILSLAFKVADDRGWLLLDLKDLRAMIQYVADHRQDLGRDYGNISTQSTGAIMRSLIRLEEEGADEFFGEPAMDIRDWFSVDQNGKGVINILSSVQLFNHPLLYATVMLWLMNELYENLEECGDLDKPRMVFFFDEAHVLFDGAPKALVSKIEQVIKLIRSKGVGIYFVTQSPSDIPDDILSQLGNRIQHALRAYTPKEQKALKAAASAFRENPELNTLEALTELGTGEALVSFLDDHGIPGVVQRAFILPPRSLMGKAEQGLIQKTIQESPLVLKYHQAVDRYSAYEEIEAESKKIPQVLQKKATTKKTTTTRSRSKKSPLERTLDSALNTIGRELGKQITRTIFGTRKR